LYRAGSTKGTPCPPVRTENNWSPEEQVVALGYSGTGGWFNAVGRILAASSYGGGDLRLMSDILLRPGMSGATVLNTRGQMVGVAVASNMEGLRLLIPSASVWQFVGNFGKPSTGSVSHRDQ